MKRFIEGVDRSQALLLPEQLDDYVSENNPVRVIDVFVNELDLAALKFEGINPAMTGRPAYHPAALLKIYIYGYLNRIQSSRRLEREAQRNVELMWLTGRLTPDFKTIANFRKDNGPAIRGVSRQFVLMCQQLGMFTDAVVAIDGSKFKAVNNHDRNFTAAKLQYRMKTIEESINRYLKDLDTADRYEPPVAALKTERLQGNIDALKAQMQKLKAIEVQLQATPDKQISLTDPDARAMKSQGTGIVGYNVQSAVDAKHHLIVAHVVTNVGSDRDQLSSVAKLARSEMGTKELTAIADRGYFNAPEIQACQDAGIDPIVAKSLTSGASADGRFGKADFIFDATTDTYRCPAGQIAIYRYTREERGLQLRRYWSSACPQCSIKTQCTPSDYRRITRWEHEDILDAMQTRLDQTPNAMRTRRQTVEHPFGTMKAWMGATHFLTRTLPKVSTEMSLHVLAYNFKRMLSILGSQTLMAAMRA
jgi:transposase